MESRPPRRLTRLLGALLLGLFLASGLAEGYHQAAVVHVFCPSDGRLAHAAEHLHADGHEHGPAEAQRETAPEEPALEADGGEPAGHHEHCGLAELGASDEADLTAGALACPPRHRSVASKIAPGARRHATVALLALAPKQSPPRAL